MILQEGNYPRLFVLHSPSLSRPLPQQKAPAQLDLDKRNLLQLIGTMQTIVTSRHTEIEEHNRRLHLINLREHETLNAIRKKLGV